MSFDIWLALSLRFYWAAWISAPKCWFYWVTFIIFFFTESFSTSIYSNLFLCSCSYWNALDCWAFDNRIFSWAFLTYSLNPAFSCNNFWIFLRCISPSSLLEAILFLYSWSSFIIFLFSFAESLRFYWAVCTSSPNPLFSWVSRFIFSCKLFIVMFMF